MNQVSRINSLANFSRLLAANDVIRFDVNNFDHRIRLQKYVFLARDYGLELGYSFNMYIHGPYSRELATDYYRIREEFVTPEEITIDASYFDIVGERSRNWLEIAATIRMIERRNPGISMEDLTEYVEMAKEYATPEIIHEVYRDIN